MVTERTTIIFGKEQLANIEAYLKSISTSLEEGRGHRVSHP